jgi:hypothetical protein
MSISLPSLKLKRPMLLELSPKVELPKPSPKAKQLGAIRRIRRVETDRQPIMLNYSAMNRSQKYFQPRSLQLSPRQTLTFFQARPYDNR